VTGKLPPNFLRHYYDIHQLLDVEAVQKFIGTPEYLEHKKKRFKSLDQNVAKSGAFTIEDENIRKQFEREYSKQPHFTIAARFLWTESSPAFSKTWLVSSFIQSAFEALSKAIVESSRTSKRGSPGAEKP